MYCLIILLLLGGIFSLEKGFSKEARPIYRPSKEISLTKETSPKELCIRKIILAGDTTRVHIDNLNEVDDVFFYHLDVPGPASYLARQLCALLIDEPFSKELIACAEQEIIDFYNTQGHPLVIVFTPKQKVTDGVLKIVVIESTIGEIAFCGNHHFTSHQLEKNICLDEGGLFDSDLAKQDLIWINRNPFRNVFLVLEPGEDEATTNLKYMTQDYRPYRFFAGSDNTGYKSTGRERLYGGIRLGNVFNLDQQLSYQFTTSVDFGRFFAHTGQYIIPFPWRHILDFYGGYSKIRAIIPTDGMTSSGHTWQGSGRYIIPLSSTGGYNHEFRFGVDYKQSNVNFVFNAIPILGSQTVISQVALGYNSSYEGRYSNTSYELTCYVSPGDIFPHQSKADYRTLRPFAESKYAYVRGAIIPIFILPHRNEIVLRSEFQWDNRNLLSSEQLGLGGLDTVRGYDQRILNTDNGLFLSGEFRTLPFCPFTSSEDNDRNERLQLLGFVDYGLGTNHKPISGEQNFFYLLSTGVGLRYHYDYNISIRVNWGYPIHKRVSKNIRQKNSTFNYAATISF